MLAAANPFPAPMGVAGAPAVVRPPYGIPAGIRSPYAGAVSYAPPVFAPAPVYTGVPAPRVLELEVEVEVEPEPKPAASINPLLFYMILSGEFDSSEDQTYTKKKDGSYTKNKKGSLSDFQTMLMLGSMGGYHGGNMESFLLWNMMMDGGKTYTKSCDAQKENCAGGKDEYTKSDNNNDMAWLMMMTLGMGTTASSLTVKDTGAEYMAPLLMRNMGGI